MCVIVLREALSSPESNSEVFPCTFYKDESKHIQGILGEHEVALRILETRFDEPAGGRRA